MKTYVSWGLTKDSKILTEEFYWADELQRLITKTAPNLVVGCRRSYGDICLNSNGKLIESTRYNRIVSFDKDAGVIVCTSGMNLKELNSVTLPSGWFVPVTPGTENVTVGGMVANDVHGKNHHNAGSFGNHIVFLELYRTNDGFLHCSEDINKELFHATIGGMGLTGIITLVGINLKKVSSDSMFVEEIPFDEFTEFDELTKESDSQWEYTVSWLDGSSINTKKIKGLFSRARHLDKNVQACTSKNKNILNIPFMAPSYLLNQTVIKTFNYAYRFVHNNANESIQCYRKYFYPLDKVGGWNKLYGVKGFFQYQFVVPFDNGLNAIIDILRTAKKYKHEPYLSVLKTFGSVRSKGLMSFPIPGYTLAMDFPNRGINTVKMFEIFDHIVLQHKGRIYCAKDSRMSKLTFNNMYPMANIFRNYIDNNISSDLWRRVNG